MPMNPLLRAQVVAAAHRDGFVVCGVRFFGQTLEEESVHMAYARGQVLSLEPQDPHPTHEDQRAIRTLDAAKVERFYASYTENNSDIVSVYYRLLSPTELLTMD